MNKKNIFKPDWQAIIQNLYASAIWWAIPLVGSLVLWALSKSTNLLSWFYSWIGQMNTPEIVKSAMGFVAPILGFAVIIRGVLLGVA